MSSTPPRLLYTALSTAAKPGTPTSARHQEPTSTTSGSTPPTPSTWASPLTKGPQSRWMAAIPGPVGTTRPPASSTTPPPTTVSPSPSTPPSRIAAPSQPPSSDAVARSLTAIGTPPMASNPPKSSPIRPTPTTYTPPAGTTPSSG